MRHTCAIYNASSGVCPLHVSRPVEAARTRRPTVQSPGMLAEAVLNDQIAQPGHSCRRAARLTANAVSSTAAQTGPQQGGLRGLYPASSPHASGYLNVSDLHTIYYEVHGNPKGTPAVVVHGGPGAGCFPNHARFFDPQRYRIVLMDQRGCGRSTPYACLAANTTSDLVADLELLRRTLGIQQWVMLGGSWGVALSLAYAQAHPHAVLGIILRGVCLMRPSEIQWMYGGGAAALKPLAWSQFVGHLPPREQANPVLGYYKRMLSSNASVRQAAAKAWMTWEMSVGFSNNQDLLVWNGQQWEAQPSPATQQQQQRVRLPPPPQPVTPAAAAAAVTAAAGLLPVLQRGACIPAEVLAGSSSSSSSDAGQPFTNSCTTAAEQRGRSTSPSAAQINKAAIGSTTNFTRTADSSMPYEAAVGSTEAQQGRQGRRGKGTTSTCAVAADGSSLAQPAWQGLNLQDPEVQQLIWQGLNHKGHQQGAAQALLECHYSLHGAFLLEQPLLDHIQRVRHIPCIAVQGQMDFVCPPTTAFELGQAWPEMELRLVPGAGHSMYDPAITHELVNATDRMSMLQPARPIVAAGAAPQQRRR